MNRVEKFSLDLGNTNKKKQLLDLHKEYCVAVNQYLSFLAKEGKYILSNEEVKELNKILPEGLKQCAYNKAVKTWKGWRRNKRKGELPVYKGCIDLNSGSIKIEKSKDSSFDYWVRISTLNKGKRVIIPFNSYDYANNYWNNWRLCNGGKIQFDNEKIFLILTFEKETSPKKKEGKVIEIDIGIKKLITTSEKEFYGKDIEVLMEKVQKKQQGSKAFKRTLRERDEYINRIAKELPYNDIKTIVMENIKNIKKNTKKDKKLRKEFRNKFQRWTYPKLFSRISQLCEIDGVHFHTVDPAWTSQSCSRCGFVHKLNRKGEIFLCRNCGYTEDADYNASKNILLSYLAQENMIPGNIRDPLFQ